MRHHVVSTIRAATATAALTLLVAIMILLRTAAANAIMAQIRPPSKPAQPSVASEAVRYGAVGDSGGGSRPVELVQSGTVVVTERVAL